MQLCILAKRFCFLLFLVLKKSEKKHKIIFFCDVICPFVYNFVLKIRKTINNFFEIEMELQNEDKNKEEEKNTKKKWQKSYFDVLGICCSSEVPLIENILKSLDGVKEYSVNVPSRTVIVVHDNLLISPFQIGKA